MTTRAWERKQARRAKQERIEYQKVRTVRDAIADAELAEIRQKRIDETHE